MSSEFAMHSLLHDAEKPGGFPSFTIDPKCNRLFFKLSVTGLTNAFFLRIALPGIHSLQNKMDRLIEIHGMPFMKFGLLVASVLSLTTAALAFPPSLTECRLGHTSFMAHDSSTNPHTDDSQSNAAEMFKILTCCSTSCASKRKALNMDPYATFAAFYSRIQDRYPAVRIEESSCLGACQQAPCVGIEHDDFVGPVSLEGMNPSEFSQRVFQRIVNEEDVDRVWRAVENAIQIMADGEQKENIEDSDSYV
jgi:(2Fe-2S) ferredoxin